VTLEMSIAWREAGCNGGGYVYFGNWPTVHLTLLGRSHQASAEQYLVLNTHKGDHQGRKTC
jgi:hypothetical protein